MRLKIALKSIPGVQQRATGFAVIWPSSNPKVNVTFDLADLRGYAYYSGTRFAIYVPGPSDALVRGGRYDEVGAVFGRNRPAAGFQSGYQAAGCSVCLASAQGSHPRALGAAMLATCS